MSKEKITVLNWQSELAAHAGSIHAIGNDFVILDRPVVPASFRHPFKIDITSVLIATAGRTTGRINLLPCDIQAPSMVVIRAGSIMQYGSMSDDFRGHVILMSENFSESLNLKESLPVLMATNENPVIPLKESELRPLLHYLDMMRGAILKSDNPYRMEVARNLTRAFFYGGGFYFHKLGQRTEKNRAERTVGEFLRLLDAHFKQHRSIEFYADRMGLSPKYMSAMIKRHSGKSAGKWIDDRIIVEAKALLKSTNMTVQQIADEFDFPEQSSFGKYFKRQTGMSPKAYRNRP